MPHKKDTPEEKRIKHNERARKYRALHRDDINLWRRVHKDWVKIYNQRYKAKKKLLDPDYDEKMREYQKMYRKNHPVQKQADLDRVLTDYLQWLKEEVE